MSTSDYAIRIKDIGKQYRIGVEQGAGMYRYKSLRDSLGGLARSPWRAVRSLLPEPMNDTNSFWALKDVSFDVKQGEVVGIIGRNGAGKSTLLKILSRITRPTTGEIELHGRVGSLLEVGTGFHPELSGRENIYLNGAVLGMTRVEVKRKFDEIVAFSEIEKFIDTPVKQYSSGMYTRLAFAVAAHLEPEILVVDEVLAVGDAEFQKKCLGKMKDVSGQGRTVLFVSHQLGQINSLCDRAALLSHGRVVGYRDARQIVEAYLAMANIKSKKEVGESQNGIEVRAHIRRCATGAQVDEFMFTDDVELVFRIRTDVPIPRAGIWLMINRRTGERVSSVCGYEEGLSDCRIVSEATYCARFKTATLAPGAYSISAQVYDDTRSGLVYSADDLWSFEIIPSPLPAASQSYLTLHGQARVTDFLRKID